MKISEISKQGLRAGGLTEAEIKKMEQNFMMSKQIEKRIKLNTGDKKF